MPAPWPGLREVPNPATAPGRRPRHGRLLQWSVAIGGLLFFAGLYLVLMRLVLDVSQLDATHSPEERDGVYLWLHSGVLLAATASGFALGKWLNGLGIAYATLFFAVVASAMMLAQVGSYSLACESGHNDIVRHWTC